MTSDEIENQLDAASEPLEETALETEPSAPEFSDEAPGFDMLADADSENQIPEPEAGDSYKVLARKYRPRNFEDLIGQEAMVQTLTNAFETGRIAHAFMLTGVRGVGKTTTARILARALNYHSDSVQAPSVALAETGAHCSAIMDGTHVDVIEMDAASRTGIGDIREIIENVRYMPASARYKVYIIDEVHMLSKAAFNGLLKTLEEPPEHVKFIFATTEIRQVPVTVLSRCQRFDLRRLSLDDTQKLLSKTCAAEAVVLPEEGLKLISRAADGSARDALSLLDRALAHMDADTQLSEDTMRGLLGLADRGRVFDLFDMLMRGNVPEALAEFEAQYAMGADPLVILADLAELTHWLTRLKFVPAALEDVAFSAELRARGKAASEQLSTPVLSRVWQILLSGHEEVPRAMNAKAACEMVLIRLAHLANTPTPDELIKQFESAPAAPAPSGASPSPSASSSAPQANLQANLSAPSPQAPSPQAPASAASGGPSMSAGSPQAAPVVQFSAPVLQDFQAVIDLAAEQRDIALKYALENGVHLVSFEAAAGERAGRLELRLADGQDNIAQDLTKKLREWTGQAWVVSLSKEQGAATLATVKRSAAEQREDNAREDPYVKAALGAFPGAEILSVSEFMATASTEALPAAPDELDEDSDGNVADEADDR
ncbi:MAG: DNA polymerase III subunit gamma/tau [Alphaproteobacteria bacterium]|jgi:DNA polymerase-3 subunit gamma/tau|nr:DNA polymerase III subunit gamma/tau [Alphaproteobacteria bacterium]